jgi:hypothetical protein
VAVYVYLFIILVSCFVYFGCAGSVRVSLAGRVIYIFCVGLRCVECRAGTILFGHYSGAGGGTVQIFLFSGSVVAGAVRLKWLGGWSVFFTIFFTLLSGLLACSCLW